MNKILLIIISSVMTLITVHVEAKETHLVCEGYSDKTYYKEGENPGIDKSFHSKANMEVLISNGSVTISGSIFGGEYQITRVTSSYIYIKGYLKLGSFNRKNGDLLLHNGKYSEIATKDDRLVYRLDAKCELSKDKVLF